MSLLGHEMGHLIDSNTSGPDVVHSSNKNWLEAWFEWRDNPIGSLSGGVRPYFTGFNGSVESFAEVCGHVMTKGKASAVDAWGPRMTQEMISILRGADPTIKLKD
jgi:hypothetical protein